MENIKVSVLVYVLNDREHIQRCVNSVINQTLQEIEILVIDGGSVDGTLEAVKTISENNSKIRILPSSPGVGFQFNTGLQAARGEYIGICESDDYLLPDMYEKQYKTAKKYQLDMLRADSKHFIETKEGEVAFFVALSKKQELYDCILDLTKDNRILQLGVNSFWSGLYRRQFLLEQKLFMNETRGAAYQDTTFSFLSSVKAKRVMLSQEAFYCYRLDNPNSSVNRPQKITMLMEEYRLLKQRLKEEGLFETYKEIYLSWKINGCLGFFDSLSQELRDSYVELMYQDLREELDSGEFEEKELSGKGKETASMIRRSISDLRRYLYGMYEGFYHTKEALERIGEQEFVILFGCGEMGRLVDSFLQHKSKRIMAYMDNNTELWGTKIRDVPVMSPQSAVCQYPDAVYIVANLTYFQEMKEQLKNLSVSEEQIIICNDYGFFFKHIFLHSLKNKGQVL